MSDSWNSELEELDETSSKIKYERQFYLILVGQFIVI